MKKNNLAEETPVHEVHRTNDGHDHGTTEDAGWKSHWQLLTALLILFLMQQIYNLELQIQNYMIMMLYLFLKI